MAWASEALASSVYAGNCACGVDETECAAANEWVMSSGCDAGESDEASASGASTGNAEDSGSNSAV